MDDASIAASRAPRPRADRPPRFRRAVVLVTLVTSAAALACSGDEVVAPRARSPRADIVGASGPSGCSSIELREVRAADSVTVVGFTADSVPAAGCTEGVRPVVDSVIEFDPATRQVRLAIALANASATWLVAPARLTARTDAIVITDPAGAENGGPGAAKVRLVSPDSASDDGVLSVWRYDTLLAASGEQQRLAPGARSRGGAVTVAIDSSVHVVQLRFDAEAATVYVTAPSAAPDGVPESVLASERAPANLIGIGDPYVSGPAPRDVVLITFHPSAEAGARQQAIDAVNGQLLGGFAVGYGMYYVRIPGDGTSSTLRDAIATLTAMPQVRRAMPDYLDVLAANFRRPEDGPDFQQWRIDPARHDGLNWGHESVAAPLAWGCATGDTSVAMGVVDRFFLTDPDLVGNVAPGAPWSTPAYAHGTRVTSVIAATGNDHRGMTGMMWNARVHLYDYGNSHYQIATIIGSEALGAVDSAIKAGNSVINLSSGLPWPTGYTPSTHADSVKVTDIARLLSDVLSFNGTFPGNLTPLLVIAAGNNPGLDAFWSAYPAVRDSFPDQVIVVAGVGRTGALAAFSQRNVSGPALVEVAAPAEDVAVLDGAGNAVPDSGTSFAAPYVSGLAGLLKSFDPRLTTAQLKSFIKRGAARGGKVASGIPIMNAYESLRVAAEQPGAPLCGNPVYRDATQSYFTRRDSSWVTQSPAMFATATTFQFPMHGGKQLLFDGGTGYVWTPSAASWAPVTPLVDSVGNATTRSKLGQSHDGDTTATVVKRPGANPRYDELWDVMLNGRLLMTISPPDAPKVNTGHKTSSCTQWPTSGLETVNCLQYFNVDTVISSSAAVSYSSARGEQGQVILAIALSKTITAVGTKYINGSYWWRDATLESGNSYTASGPTGTYLFFIDVKTATILRREFIRSQANTGIGFSEDGKHYVTRRVFRAINTSYVQNSTSTSRTITCSVDYKPADPAGATRLFTLASQSNVTDCYPEATFAP